MLVRSIEKLPLPILGSMFPFWSPTGVFLQSVAHVEKDKPRCFLLPFRVNPRHGPSSSAPPEGEGAPGSSGPVHSGQYGPINDATVHATAAVKALYHWHGGQRLLLTFPTVESERTSSVAGSFKTFSVGLATASGTALAAGPTLFRVGSTNLVV